MKLKVTAPDLRWKGVRILKGAPFEANTDRERELADLLVRIGKAEEVKGGPVRRAHVEAPTAKSLEWVDPRLDHDGNGKQGGSVAVTAEEPFEDMTDDQLREFIEKRDGEKPHFRLGRPKLLALANKTDDAEPRVGEYKHRAMRAEGSE